MQRIVFSNFDLGQKKRQAVALSSDRISSVAMSRKSLRSGGVDGLKMNAANPPYIVRVF